MAGGLRAQGVGGDGGRVGAGRAVAIDRAQTVVIDRPGAQVAVHVVGGDPAHIHVLPAGDKAGEVAGRRDVKPVAGRPRGGTPVGIKHVHRPHGGGRSPRGHGRGHRGLGHRIGAGATAVLGAQPPVVGGVLGQPGDADAGRRAQEQVLESVHERAEVAGSGNINEVVGRPRGGRPIRLEAQALDGRGRAGHRGLGNGPERTIGGIAGANAVDGVTAVVDQGARGEYGAIVGEGADRRATLSQGIAGGRCRGTPDRTARSDGVVAIAGDSRPQGG